MLPEYLLQHSMGVYCEKLFRGYLDKSPEYRIPPPGNVPTPIDEIRPVVSGITIHKHGTELALVMEGSNFWFCNRLSICRESIDTPASQITGSSIKLNFDKVNKRSLSLLTNEQEIVVKVYNHFLKSPSSVTFAQEYPVSTRQRQLA